MTARARLAACVMVALLLGSAVPMATGAADPEKVVWLRWSPASAGVAAVRSCAVTVAVDASVMHVLDAAVAEGCILAWSSAGGPGAVRVASLDHVPEAVATAWRLVHNGVPVSTGLDALRPAGGDALHFVYAQDARGA